MLMPRKTKYRKSQKGRNAGVATRGAEISFGSFGLKALENERITSRQIEAARIAMTRRTKRGGQVWIKIFPDTPVTRKPAEVRMGNGKGSVEYYVAKVQSGKMLYEMGGVDRITAVEALALAAAKLPIRTKFIAKADDPWA